MERRVINPWPWSVDFGFHQAVETSNAAKTLFCSGQTAADANGALQFPGDMGAQLLASWQNLETVLEESGYQPAHITRLVIYVTDVDAFMGGAYTPLAERMSASGVETSMTLIGVDRLAFDGQVCEIEATAVK